MSEPDLKACLARFPAAGWNDGLDMDGVGEDALRIALTAVLDENGRFPVPWSETEDHEGLFVVRSSDGFIGHFTEGDVAEGIDATVSVTTEHLGGAGAAVDAIHKHYFGPKKKMPWERD